MIYFAKFSTVVVLTAAIFLQSCGFAALQNSESDAIDMILLPGSGMALIEPVPGLSAPARIHYVEVLRLEGAELNERAQNAQIRKLYPEESQNATDLNMPSTSLLGASSARPARIFAGPAGGLIVQTWHDGLKNWATNLGSQTLVKAANSEAGQKALSKAMDQFLARTDEKFKVSGVLAAVTATSLIGIASFAMDLLQVGPGAEQHRALMKRLNAIDQKLSKALEALNRVLGLQLLTLDHILITPLRVARTQLSSFLVDVQLLTGLDELQKARGHS